MGQSVTPALTSAKALRRRYAPPSGGFSVLLVGKDGGIKLRSTHPLAAGALGETIDAMPMRRRERSRRAAGGPGDLGRL